MKNLLPVDTKEYGFTLVEILVVILIIGILAAIALPVFLNQRKTAVDVAVHSDAKNTLTAIQTYIADNKGSQMPVNATVIKPILGGAGKAASAGTTIALSGNSEEYCVLVINGRSNMTTWGEAKKFVYYNSKNGGWQDNSILYHSTSCTIATGTSWTHIYG